MKHKLRRAVRREVQIEVRRQMARLKQELVSAQIHSTPEPPADWHYEPPSIAGGHTTWTKAQ